MNEIMEGLQSLDCAISKKCMLTQVCQIITLSNHSCVLEPPARFVHSVSALLSHPRLGYWTEIRDKCHSLMNESSADFLGVKDMS